MSKFNRLLWPVAVPATAALSLVGLVGISSAASAVGPDQNPLAGSTTERPDPATVPYYGAHLALTRDGVIVRGVVPGGPADEAGIQSGDKLVSVNGVSFDHRGAIREALASVQPGDVVTVVYERGGVQTTVQVEVGSQADRPALADRPWFGAFPAAPDGNPSTGLTIGYVGDGSPAATAGLMVGDQVLTVNGADVTQGPGALATLRSMSPGDTLVLGIMRDGKPMTITVVLGSQADNPNREAEIAARQAHRQERRDNRQQRQSDRRGEWGIPGIRPGGPHGPGGPGGNAGFGQGGFSGGAAA